MSGKRQHFIPQFLQRGFSSHSDSGKYYTWVFRKDSSPFNTNIKNIGIENEFYTLDGNSKVDEKITKLENSLGRLIFKIRNEPFGKLEFSKIPKLIAHIEIRTRHLRQNFLQANVRLVQEIENYLSKSNVFINYAKRNIQNKDSTFYKTLIDELQNNGLSKNIAETFVKNSPEQIIGLLENTAANSLNIFGEALHKIDIESVIKKGHIDALDKSITPEIRIEFFDKFSYYLVEDDNKSLIQGDSAILFRVEDGYKTFVSKTDDIKAIYLPLSPSKLLIGKNESLNFDISKLPQLLSEFSLEYFIASEKNDSLKDLQANIGSKARILEDEEIAQMVKEELFN